MKEHMKSWLRRSAGAQSESGQAIVLIALFMLILLAMVGVALDGGGLFLLWRDAQNAADAAALEAAFSKCTSPTTSNTWISVGEDAAEVNGFDNATDNTVVVDEDGVYVVVTITADKPAYFIQLVYPGPLRVTAVSKVYCQRAINFASLPGAVAFGDCGCPALQDPPDYTSGGTDSFGASISDASITGGVHSNCDITIQGNASGESVEFIDAGPTATGTVDLGQSSVAYSPGVTSESGVDPVEGDPLSLPIEIYMPGGEVFEHILSVGEHAYAIDAEGDGVIDAIEPSGNSVWKPDSNGCHLPYCNNNQTPAMPVPFEGLFYVDGDVDLSDLDDSDVGTNGITIVASGQIKFPDPGEFDFEYYGVNKAVTGVQGVTAQIDGQYWPLVLAFSNQNDNSSPCNVSQSSAIQINNSDQDDARDIFGLIYAPNGYVRWNGNNVNGEGAMVALKIDWGGSGVSWIYDPTVLPPRPPNVNAVE